MKIQKNFIDLKITPKNAKSRGYKYIGDIIYDIHKPNEMSKEILELIAKNGYRLGAPSQSYNSDPYFGLYMPIHIQL